ncbi:hypothetical protein NKG99_07040 [Mesorhizobium sp. M1409]|uniref:hypothetical protein n=1 Tax=unclassified Mesorhizobium TaxID=325217 RepID=UPI00333AAF71
MLKKMTVYGREYDVAFDAEVVRANRRHRRYIVNGGGYEDRYLLVHRESVQQALERMIDCDREAEFEAA